jgi:tetratricopeptide (TPR) repeat protein
MCLGPTVCRIIGHPVSAPFQESAQSYWEKGNELLRSDRCDEAVEAFRKALAISPASGAYNDLGRAYMCLNEFSKAEASFKQALRIKPENVNALYNLGVAYAHQVKIDEAKNVLRALQSRDPEKANELETEIREARVAASRLAETDTALNSANALFSVTAGNKYYKSEDYVRAIEAYKKAISYRPSKNAYSGLGLAYEAVKQYPNAVAAFQEAIHLEPGDPELHCNLATVYLQMGELEKTENSAREALRLKSDYVDPMNLLGVVQFRRKEYALAVSQFQKALRLEPNDPVINHNLGKTYFLMGRRTEAESIYRKLLTLDKEQAQKLYEVMHPPAKKM